jgi:hypothetical protein
MGKEDGTIKRRHDHMVDNKGVRYILPETLPEAYLTLFINICK